MEIFPRLKPVGDRAVLIEMGNVIAEDINQRTAALGRKIAGYGRMDILEVVPAFASVLVYYDPLQTGYREMAKVLQTMAEDVVVTADTETKAVDIPVCYGGVYGADLPFVSKHTGLTEQEVIKLHSGRIYRIYMLGFLP